MTFCPACLCAALADKNAPRWRRTLSADVWARAGLSNSGPSGPARSVLRNRRANVITTMAKLECHRTQPIPARSFWLATQGRRAPCRRRCAVADRRFVVDIRLEENRFSCLCPFGTLRPGNRHEDESVVRCGEATPVPGDRGQ
jgi:hypothetical protein